MQKEQNRKSPYLPSPESSLLDSRSKLQHQLTQLERDKSQLQESVLKDSRLLHEHILEVENSGASRKNEIKLLKASISKREDELREISLLQSKLKEEFEG